MDSIVATPITCRLCRAIIASDGVAIIGQNAEEKQQEFITRLWQHLQQHHPGRAQDCFIRGEELKGFLLLQQFSITDKELQNTGDRLRYRVHQQTRRIVITDAGIRQKVAELLEGAENPELEAEVVALMVEMRNLAFEVGRYPDEAPPQTEPPQTATVTAEPAPEAPHASSGPSIPTNGTVTKR